jgi:antitoxin (DNA-binding transcriptional repressor) of toxin-antitoxin stability system
MEVTVSEAKAKFSELVKRVEQGESVIITRHGKPVVELRDPNIAARRRNIVGSLKGKIWIADDFDETPQDVLDALNKGIDPDE